MTCRTRMALRFAIAAIVGAGCLVVSEKALFQQGFLTTSADARVGRPLTPVSYAGVARRTTRRAVTYGAAGVPVVATPRCVQAVNANGRIYTRCY
jgi:hypothetical protein